MKRNLLLSVFISLFATCLISQSVIPNFVVDDCDGISTDLFEEMDAGKIIVLSWVMPCGPCLGPALTAYNIHKDFKEEGCNVEYYLIDDFGNTNCNTLSNWGNSYKISNVKVISNSQVNMIDYGGIGMPKIMLLGGEEHKVYHHELNSLDPNAFLSAMETACSENLTATLDVTQNPASLNVYPNPVSDNFIISFRLPSNSAYTLDMINSMGQNVKHIQRAVANGSREQMEISRDQLPSGMYSVLLQSEAGIKQTKVLIN